MFCFVFKFLVLGGRKGGKGERTKGRERHWHTPWRESQKGKELIKSKKYYHLYKKNVVQEPKNEVGEISQSVKP